MKAWAPPEEAPAGQLVPVRIRLGVRLAVRDARVHWGHALVVMALVALPVSLIVGFYLLGMSVAAAEAAQPIPGEDFGAQADGSAFDTDGWPTAGWSDPLPDDWRLVEWPVLDASRGGSLSSLSGTAGDFTDPVIAGLVELTQGRLPANDREVLVSRAVVDELGLTVGSLWDASLSWWRPETGQVDDLSRRLTVVGIGEPVGEGASLTFAMGGGLELGVPTRYLIDSPEPISEAQVNEAWEKGVTVFGGEERPPSYGIVYSPFHMSGSLVIGVTCAVLQVVVLAGAAFAVSLRRRQRELALLSAAGAEPSDLIWAMLASGLVLGGAGAILGLLLPWVVVVVGRPALEWVLPLALAPFPPMQPAIALVPLGGLLAALLASMVPAAMAVRIPTEAALRAGDPVQGGGLHKGSRTGGMESRSALAGVGILVLSIMGIARSADGSGDPGFAYGWVKASLGLWVILAEVGVVLLCPMLLALITRHVTWLPVSARLASRDASRNRLRTSFAVAAVAVAVGLVSGYLTWIGSNRSANERADALIHVPRGLLLVPREVGYADLGAGFEGMEPTRYLGPELGWGPGMIPIAFALLATLLVTRLALAEAGPDLATAVAVGASPGVRRLFAMWAAILLAAVGAALGVLTGIAPAWAALRALDQPAETRACVAASEVGDRLPETYRQLQAVRCDVTMDVPLDVPWSWLAMVVIVLPVVSGLFFLIVTRSKVRVPRR